jgi:hypothetical protein
MVIPSPWMGTIFGLESAVFDEFDESSRLTWCGMGRFRGEKVHFSVQMVRFEGDREGGFWGVCTNPGAIGLTFYVMVKSVRVT